MATKGSDLDIRGEIDLDVGIVERAKQSSGKRRKP